MWLRLQQYSSGSWSLGHEVYYHDIGCSNQRRWWLTVSNDDEWRRLGLNNLCAIISEQKEQLRAVEAARIVVEQRRKEVEEIDKAFSAAKEFLYETSESLRHIESLSRSRLSTGIFREEELKDVVRSDWYRNERDKRIRDVYRAADSYDFEKIAEDYAAIIQEIKTGVAHLERLCELAQPAQDGHEEPPVLPWLRTESYFKKGDKIIGWSASNKWQASGSEVYRYWDPLPDKLLFGPDKYDKVEACSGFLEKCAFYSPRIMLVQEAKYYQAHDSYRRFLMGLIEMDTGKDQELHDILASIGRLKYPIRWRSRLC